jgi:hypothetical protein
MKKLLIVPFLALSVQALDFGYQTKDGMKGMFVKGYDVQFEYLNSDVNSSKSKFSLIDSRYESNLTYSPKFEVAHGIRLSMFVSPKIGLSIVNNTHTEENMIKSECQVQGLDYIQDSCTTGGTNTYTKLLLGASFGMQYKLEENIAVTVSTGSSFNEGDVKVETTVGFSIDF